MAELPGYLYTQPLPRGRGGARAPGAVPRTLAAAPPSGGAQALGAGLGAVADTLDTLGEQMQRARQVADEASGLSTGLELLETTRQAVVDNRTLAPLDRAQTFTDQLTPQLDQAFHGFTPESRARVMGSLATRIQATRRELHDAGQKTFVADALGGLETVLGQLQRQDLSATNDLDRATVRDSQAALVQSYVQSGFFTVNDGVARLTKLRDDTAILQTQTLIRQEPQLLYTQLLRGPAANPEIPPAAYPALLKEAEAAATHALQLREATAASGRRQLQERQSVAASEFRTQIFQPGITVPTLIGLVPQINEARRTQTLGEQDHTSLLQHVETLLTRLRDDAYKDRDVPAVRQDLAFAVETADTPAQLDAAQAQVRAQAPQLSSGSVQSLLARIEARRTQGAYTNRDAYKEGRQLILGAGFPGGIVQATLDSLDGTTKTKLSSALDIYAETMQSIYENQGQRQGDTQAREKARALKELYFPRDERESYLPGLPPEFQGMTYQDAVLKLDTMDLAPTLKRQLFAKIKAALPNLTPNPQATARPAGPNTKRGEAPK